MTCCEKTVSENCLAREAVYAAIVKAKESYWDDRDMWVGITLDKPLDRKQSVSAWLISIADEYHSVEANCSIGNFSGKYSLELIANLGAMCVMCMETHGCIERKTDPCCGYATQPDRFVPMSNDEIWSVLNTERDYQDKKWQHDATDKRPVDLAGYMLTFERYLRKAIDAYVDHVGDTLALDGVRKLAAITVACLEKHGAPLRV